MCQEQYVYSLLYQDNELKVTEVEFLSFFIFESVPISDIVESFKSSWNKLVFHIFETALFTLEQLV